MDALAVILMGGPKDGSQLGGLPMFAISPGRLVPVMVPMWPLTPMSPVWVERGCYELRMTPVGWVGYWREPLPDGRV